MEIEASPPRPIDNGQVAQAVVQYAGSRLGVVTYRGSSGRRYRFSAFPSDSRQYVLEEDLKLFERLVDFRVLEETRIDPEAGKLRAIEAAVGGRLVEEVTNLLAPLVAGKQKRSPQKRGGRPPVPLEELQRLWHLRHHSLPPQSLEALATEFLGNNYATPRATISTRLARFKKSHPELISEDNCPWCTKGYASNPPATS